MKLKNIILKYLMYIIIPTLSVLLSMASRLAQGEKNEEIVFGVILGIVLDFIYSTVLLFVERKSNSNKSK